MWEDLHEESSPPNVMQGLVEHLLVPTSVSRKEKIWEEMKDPSNLAQEKQASMFSNGAWVFQLPKMCVQSLLCVFNPANYVSWCPFSTRLANRMRREFRSGNCASD